MPRKLGGVVTLLLALPSSYYFTAAAVMVAAFVAFGGQATHSVSSLHELIGMFLGAFMIIGAAAMASFIALVTAGVMLLRNRGRRFAAAVLGVAGLGAGIVLANSILRGASLVSLSFVGPAAVMVCDTATMLLVLGSRDERPGGDAVDLIPTR